MTETDSVRPGSPSGEAPGQAARPLVGRLFLTIPLILVNGAAIWGQYGWAYSHITNGALAGVLVAILFAVSVESIGAYLAWEAHEARLGDRAYAGLQLASYSVGGFAGWLNYEHFASSNVTQAVTFGVMSALSPWLWGVYSRAQNTERLDALGLMDTRGVKLSNARKLWHPRRSIEVIRWAAWEGVTHPADAVAGYEADHDPEAVERRAKREALNATVSLPDDVPRLSARRGGRSAAETRTEIARLRGENPGITQRELAAELGISDRRVREVLRSA